MEDVSNAYASEGTVDHAMLQDCIIPALCETHGYGVIRTSPGRAMTFDRRLSIVDQASVSGDRALRQAKGLARSHVGH